MDTHSSIVAIYKWNIEIMNIHNSHVNVYNSIMDSHNSIMYIHNLVTDMNTCIMEK